MNVHFEEALGQNMLKEAIASGLNEPVDSRSKYYGFKYKHNGTTQTVLEMLGDTPKTATDISRETGFGYEAVKSALQRLANRNLCRKSKGPGRSNLWVAV